MKSKLLFLSFFMLLMVTTNYAQTSASQAGIAVQGIARDANNTATANQSISLTFELYYFNSSNTEVPIYTETLNIQTDAFGVFSHVIDPGAVNSPKIANNLGYLRIKKGVDIISNEKLNHVPYAISANNGVPVGAIMPFIGSEAPDGWAICNGGVLPSTASELKTLLGSNNTPDLRGMFLRGAETNSDSQYANNVGPSIKTIQKDNIKSHIHAVNLTTSYAGKHRHDIVKGPLDQNGSSNMPTINNTSDSDEGWGTILGGQDATSEEPHHIHTVDGNTKSTGDTETRPVNYGVNYIIKL